MKIGEVSKIDIGEYRINISWQLYTTFISLSKRGGYRYVCFLIYSMSGMRFGMFSDMIFKIITKVAINKNIDDWYNERYPNISFDSDLFLNSVLEGGTCI